MKCRESHIVRSAEWVLAVWVTGFAVDLIVRGGKVTSNQWRYLMLIPGHQWTWAAIFGTASVVAMAGLARSRYRWIAVGLALMGAGSTGIAAFYLVAPFIDPGLTTLGYSPWFIVAGIELLGAVLNWRPAQWF